MTKIKTNTYNRLSDTITPVSIYLKARDVFPNSILLESSDYHGQENSYSFICLNPIADFKVEASLINIKNVDGLEKEIAITDKNTVNKELDKFVKSFDVEIQENHINGFFGYYSFDAVQYFESLDFKNKSKDEYQIPEMYFSLFQFVISINHYKNELTIIENIAGEAASEMDKVIQLLSSKGYPNYTFTAKGNETSNLKDDDFRQMVTKGKEHCQRGDVFQLVLSRQFQQAFKGDEFNVYRALRSINPSPYLFYFDFGNYKIFGSSPEAQLVVKDNKATINPIAGTFKRTGDDVADRELAEKLTKDPKENAEHVMLVDLARNDLSKNSNKIEIKTYKEIQFYSHVIHLVSQIEAEIKAGTNTFKLFGDSFPAGTLSGAPKYKALQLIDKYENQSRGFYGGSIGFIGFDGAINQAITIRSYLSKNNKLFYQAGAGIVSDSKEENELQEVNNKLMALKKAIKMAEGI